MKTHTAFNLGEGLSRARMNYDEANESRADWGEAAIIAGDPDFGSNEAITSAKDTIGNICHALDRMGLRDELDYILGRGRDVYEEEREEEAPAKRCLERYADPLEGVPELTP